MAGQVRVVRNRRAAVRSQRVALRARAKLRRVRHGTRDAEVDDVGGQVFVHDVFRTTVNVSLVRAAPRQARMVRAIEDGSGQGLPVQRNNGDGVRVCDPQQRRPVSPAEMGERRGGERVGRERDGSAGDEPGGMDKKRRRANDQVRGRGGQIERRADQSVVRHFRQHDQEGGRDAGESIGRGARKERGESERGIYAIESGQKGNEKLSKPSKDSLAVRSSATRDKNGWHGIALCQQRGHARMSQHDENG